MQFKIANNVQHLLKDSGVEYAILGGYPRDKAYGRLPKDVDFFVYNTEEDTSEQLIRRIQLMYTAATVELAYEGDDANFVYAVVQIGKDCDIVIYKKEFETAQDILDVFDFNINQWQLVDGIPVFKGQDESTLVQLKSNGALTHSRKLKMQRLALELNWDLGKCIRLDELTECTK